MDADGLGAVVLAAHPVAAGHNRAYIIVCRNNKNLCRNQRTIVLRPFRVCRIFYPSAVGAVLISCVVIALCIPQDLTRAGHRPADVKLVVLYRIDHVRFRSAVSHLGFEGVLCRSDALALKVFLCLRGLPAQGSAAATVAAGRKHRQHHSGGQQGRCKTLPDLHRIPSCFRMGKFPSFSYITPPRNLSTGYPQKDPLFPRIATAPGRQMPFRG